MTSERLDPFTEDMGIRCAQTEPGKSVATLDARPEHCNKNGFIHGAVLFAMADIGMGSVVAAALDHEQRVVSLSINVNYVKAATPGVLTADSRIVRLGKTIAVTRAELRNTEGDICALFTADFHITEYAP